MRPMAASGAGTTRSSSGMAAGRRQDLPDAPGGPRRRRAGPRRRRSAYLETHGRAETRRAGRGPRGDPAPARSSTAAPSSRRWTCRRSSSARPSSCLIDELAHTNAPGVEHRKRYEDIDDVLDAGIDVFSTVNVQHLECAQRPCRRADRRARARDASRTRCSARADEVVLDRPHPRGADRSACARARSTRPSASRRRSTASSRSRTCPALREVALRQVAEEVESQRAGRAGEALGTREERLFGGRRRRRWPSACSRSSRPTSRLAAARPPGLALGAAPRRPSSTSSYVAPPGEPPRARGARAPRGAATARRRCSARDLIVEEGDDLAEVAARVAARARHELTLILGQPASARTAGRMHRAAAANG